MITINVKITFTKEELIDIISAAVYSIGYWCVINNDTEEWKKMSKSLSKDCYFEDVFFALLESGKEVELYDREDEKSYFIDLNKLGNGIKLAIEQHYWDGDLDKIDGEIGDIIFQFAIFNEIVFCY